MPATIETTTPSGSALAVSSITWSHTITAANKIMVTVGIGDATLGNRQVSSVTFNGAALTQVGEADDGTWDHVEIWERHTPDIVTGNVVVTFAGTVAQCACGATGVLSSATALGAPSSNTTTSTNPTVTVTDSTSGDLVVSIVGSDSGSVATMTEGGTLLWEVEDIAADIDVNAQYQTASGASTVCSWTCSSSQLYAAMGVAVKESVVSRSASLLNHGLRPRPFAPGMAR